MKSPGQLKKPSYSALILAGGESSRMGYPKCWIRMNGKTFLEKIFLLYSNNPLIRTVVVVLNAQFAGEPYDKAIAELGNTVRLVLNHEPHRGRLYSIQLGLKEIDTDYVFIHNVDNPFLHPVVIDEMIAFPFKEEVCLPFFDKKSGHPILIRQNVQQALQQSTKKCETLRQFLSTFSRSYVQVSDSTIFPNINSGRDLKTFEHEFS